VLIAEDDAVCRKMLARVLKSMNYEVAEAEDGAVALEMMRASTKSDDGTGHPFDLVLSDYTMPNMEGPESVAGMREAGYTGPIFGVTGNQLQSDIDLFIAKGADKVIAKPLKLPALKQAIQEYEGHGTTTTTSLTSRRATTMAVSSKGGANKATASPAAAPSAKDASGLLRVLIAEDDAVCRKMLARVLKSMNYEVAEAEDGAVALEMMRASLIDDGTATQLYDLVLSDFTMPNMDGPESVAGMREAGYTGPIFGVTGNQLQADIDLFIAKGADKVIAKPLKLPALKQAIHDYKEQRRVQGMLMLQSY